jgi:hypothetical protein
MRLSLGVPDGILRASLWRIRPRRRTTTTRVTPTTPGQAAILPPTTIEASTFEGEAQSAKTRFALTFG